MQKKINIDKIIMRTAFLQDQIWFYWTEGNKKGRSGEVDPEKRESQEI